MSKLRAFTLIEVLVVIAIISLLMAILLPVFGKARTSARHMQSSAQQRGIHQGFVTYSMEHDGFYPGLVSLTNNRNADTTDAADIETIRGGSRQAGLEVIARFAISFEHDLFTPEYAISPGETNKKVQPWDPNKKYNLKNNHVTSYALSKLYDVGQPIAMGRAESWQRSGSSSAIVLGDRATVLGRPGVSAAYQGLWSEGKPGFLGTVVFNDNSTVFSFDELIQQTTYGGHRNTEPDDIFRGHLDPNRGTPGFNTGNNCDLVVTTNGPGRRANDNSLAAE